MEGTDYTTPEAVLRRAQELIGIPLKEIDKTGRLSTGKGAIGTVIEESWFGYPPNSESEPDLPEAGVELKVTPYIRTKHGIRAKERLVCGLIDYMKDPGQAFDDSAFLHKCGTMLLLFYEHKESMPKGDLTIDKAVLFHFPEEDLAIVRHDWETIMDKIRSGRAHELSEGDTLYLAACTKGANAGVLRSQPFSETPAKQRAYSLKPSYMTRILNTYIFGDEQSERVVKDPRILARTTFERYIEELLQPYYGKTVRELQTTVGFGIDLSSKNHVERLLARMVGVDGRIGAAEEFRKAGIVPKTVRLEADGCPKESMSFPTFDFIKLMNETWESSELYQTLSGTRFLFAVFRRTEPDSAEEAGGREYRFEGIRFWNMPPADLEEVRRVWERTVQTIERGVVLTQTARGVANDLPKKAQSRVAHVRPHGRDANDRLPLPDGRMMTKQCFWLNAEYIAEQLKGPPNRPAFSHFDL